MSSSYMKDFLKERSNSDASALTIVSNSGIDVMSRPAPVPLQARTALIKPFNVRSIEHTVSLDGQTFHVRAYNFSWSHSPGTVFANVSITFSGKIVYSDSSLMLIYSYRPDEDCVNKLMGSFANAGLQASRNLIDACLYPIQNQVIEVKRRIESST